jgi:GDP-L-fucose synthase
VRILVTGGGGFLGSHLVERLRAKGEEPFVSRSREYDLTSQADAERLFRDARPELVFHLAAEVGGIGANRAHPGRYWYANLLMGANVLEESRRAGIRKLVVVGTVCSYPELTPVPFQEGDLWAGYPEATNAPYGVAKKALLVGAQAYRSEYGLETVFLLPANLYGPRDDFDLESSHVIPALVRRMVEARESGRQEVVLWGDGTPTREFLYVEDCARALVLAAERYEGSEPVNVGTGEEISIRDLAALVARLSGYGGEVVWDTSKPNGQPRRRLDVSRAEQLLGFRAETALEDGLGRTIEWYERSRGDQESRRILAGAP